MNTFYLIRHGQKENIKEDPGLTELGQKQAKITGDYLKNKNVLKVFSSPQKRALQTALIIGKKLSLKVKIDKRLKERIDWGDYPDLPLAEFLKKWDYSSLHRNFKPEFGDSSIDAGNRLKMFICEISKKFPGKNIVLATHGGLITDLLRNLFSEEKLQKYKQDFPEEKGKECSITVLVKNNNDYLLKQVGSTDHHSC